MTNNVTESRFDRVLRTQTTEDKIKILSNAYKHVFEHIVITEKNLFEASVLYAQIRDFFLNDNGEPKYKKD